MHVAVHRCTRKRSLDAGSWRHSLCISYRELPQQGALYAPAKNWFPGDGAWTAGAHQKECVRPRHQSTHMLAGPSGGYKRELPTTDGAGKYKFEQSPMDPCVFMLRRWTGDGPQSPTWGCHVDDLLVGGPCELQERFKPPWRRSSKFRPGSPTTSSSWGLKSRSGRQRQDDSGEVRRDAPLHRGHSERSQ